MPLNPLTYPARARAKLPAILATALLVLLASPGRLPAQGPLFTEDPTVNAFHLYVVDVTSLSDQQVLDAQSYIASRWRILGGPTRRPQRGLLVLMEGIHGLHSSSAPLSPDAADQLETIRIAIDHARAQVNPQARPGLELNETADIIRQHLRRQMNEEIQAFQRQNRAGGLLIIVHLVAGSFFFTPLPGGDTVPLQDSQYPDSCFGAGVLVEEIHGFPDRLRRVLGASNGAALRGPLVFVPTGVHRHVPSAERAAALKIFGDALFNGTARAMRDALDCLEVNAEIDLARRSDAACAPGGLLPPSPSAPRVPGSCLPVSAYAIATDRTVLQRNRVATIIASLAANTDIMKHATPQSLTPLAPPQVSAPSAPPPQASPTPRPPVATPQAPRPQPTQLAARPPVQGPPAQGSPVPAQPSQLQRITAITSKASLPANIRPTMNVNGRLDGAPGSVTVHLLPTGHALGTVEPGDQFDITRGTTALLPAGQYSVVARVAQTAGCDTDGRIAFRFALYGWRVGRESSEFSISLANTCHASERVVPLATLDLR